MSVVGWHGQQLLLESIVQEVEGRQVDGDVLQAAGGGLQSIFSGFRHEPGQANAVVAVDDVRYPVLWGDRLMLASACSCARWAESGQEFVPVYGERFRAGDGLSQEGQVAFGECVSERIERRATQGLVAGHGFRGVEHSRSCSCFSQGVQRSRQRCLVVCEPLVLKVGQVDFGSCRDGQVILQCGVDACRVGCGGYAHPGAFPVIDDHAWRVCLLEPLLAND